jgi:hypothetical protein
MGASLVGKLYPAVLQGWVLRTGDDSDTWGSQASPFSTDRLNPALLWKKKCNRGLTNVLEFIYNISSNKTFLSQN